MRKWLVKLLAVAALVLGGLPIFAQNLVVNGDFEQGNTGFMSHYTYTETGVIEAGCYCIDYSSAGHGGGIGWPTVLGYGGSGKYMIVNGFGGENVNPNKVIWSQTVNVAPQTDYALSCQVVNLGMAIWGYSPNPAKLHVFINGNDMGVEYVLSPDNDWHLWEPLVWNSGTAMIANIAFYDFYTGDSGLGDDFGLDQITFGPTTNYTVTANDDQAGPFCLDAPNSIDVLDNDILQPNGNDATVSIVVPPEYGTASVLSNNYIEYTFTDANYTGSTDQFQYRVNNHGATDEAWVIVTLNRTPTVGTITPFGVFCIGESFEPTEPNVNDNGSPITNSGWEYATAPNGPWNALSLNPFNLTPNDYYLRFWAENSCGRSESEPTPLRVCDKPELNTTTISEPPIVCEGAWLSAEYLAQVWVTNWNNDYGSGSWEVSHGNGIWITQTSLSNGDWLRYRAVNCCGEVVTDAVMVNTTQGPEFSNDPYPNPFASYYCLGEMLIVPSDHPQYDSHGMYATGFWAYLEGNEYQRIDGNPTLTAQWDGRIITYVLDSDCGGLIPYREQYPITVISPPEVQIVSVAETACVGGPIAVDYIVEWHHGTPDLQHSSWQYAPVDNPSNYQDFYLTDGIPEEGVYYVNYHAVVNECGFFGDGAIPAVVTVLYVEDEWLEPIQACDVYTLPSGEEVTTSTEWTTESDIPCHHIVHQPVVIYHSDSVVDLITSCHDVFEWHGQTFERSDETQIAYWQTTNTHDCDSVVELHLDFGPYAEFTHNRTACNSYIWEMNPDMIYMESTQDTVFVPAQDDTDCDTYYYLDLTLGHDEVVDVDTTVCNAFGWYGHWCNATATYSHHFETSLGCDSLVNLHVTLNNAVTYNRLVSACDSITINGVLYDVPGVYRIPLDTLEASNGCDSIIICTLTLNNSVNIGTIHGESNVYVATNLISGIYRYSIDSEGIIGNVQWSLSQPDWTIVDQDALSCRIMVTTVGHATLTATFHTDCGEVERTFEIQSGFYDLDDYQSVATRVFPNPTQGTMTVEAEGIKSVRVIDMLGQTFHQERFDGADSVTIRLHSLPSSVYLLEIQTEKGRAMQRIVLCK